MIHTYTERLKYCSFGMISRFLTKLLTEDLPQLFVRPKKIVLDFQKREETQGSAAVDLGKSQPLNEGNKDFLGELSVTLVDARNVPYVPFGMIILFNSRYYVLYHA